MAIIKIEKKKTMWLWILLVVAIIAIIFYFLSTEKIKEEKTEEPKTVNLLNVKENNRTVADFINFVDNDLNKMSMDHKYSHDALIKLADATQAMANEINYVIMDDLSKVKEYAVMITKDSLADTHANNIRSAADILTNALQIMQLSKYPDLSNESTELSVSKNSINPNVHALNQRDAVKLFFNKAANLLRKMN